MYGENLIEILLDSFTFQEILEMNDLTEAEVLNVLLYGGYISEPQKIISEFEGHEEASAEGFD